MTADSVHTEELVALADDLPVRSLWSYDASEPFTISVSFQTEEDCWVEWLFARDLLVNGLTGPSGIGDVRLRPRRTNGRTALPLVISYPHVPVLSDLDADSGQPFPC